MYIFLPYGHVDMQQVDKAFQLSFNSSLRVDFQGSRVISDGGLILVRELEEHLWMGALIEQHLTDTRRGRNTQFPLADLLRQSVYSRLAGYEDVNDAERVSADPTFRLIGSEKIWERGAALMSRLDSFETELLAEAENLAGLTAINRELIGRAEGIDSPRRVVLDMDSTDRLPANNRLERDIAELLTRPVGRPSHQPVVRYKSFLYQAASWDKDRRVVAKVEHHRGELSPRVGFIVTSLSLPSQAVYGSTISGARRSSGSRQANRRRTGHGCRVIGSGPMNCAYS